MLLPLCAALALAATPTEVTDAASSSAHASPFALHVTLATVPVSSSVAVVGLGVLGGLGGDSAAPHAGLAAEVRFASHWTVSLGADVGFASGAVGLPATQLSVGAIPGVRWYARDAFDGPFLALEVPLGWAQFRSRFVDADGVTQTSELSSLGVGASALAGWVFAWDNGLLVSCAAGPSVSLRRASFGGASELSSASVGLKLQLGVGVRL